MKRTLLSLVIIGLLAALIAGCGGGGGGSRSHSGQKAQARFTIKWPAASASSAGVTPHLISALSNSVVISAYKASDFPGSTPNAGSASVVPPVVAARPQGGAAPSTITLSGLPANTDLKLFIEARPNADGTGTTQSSAVFALTGSNQLKPGVTKNIPSVTLQSTVQGNHMAITPSNATVVIGQPTPLQMSYQAYDGDPAATAPPSSIVLLDPTKVTWDTGDHTIATISPAGVITPIKPGTTTVTVTYQEGSAANNDAVTATGSATLTIKAAGSIPGQNGVSYVLNTTLTFGAWGQRLDRVHFETPTGVAISGNNIYLSAYLSDRGRAADQGFYEGPRSRVVMFQYAADPSGTRTGLKQQTVQGLSIPVFNYVATSSKGSTDDPDNGGDGFGTDNITLDPTKSPDPGFSPDDPTNSNYPNIGPAVGAGLFAGTSDDNVSSAGPQDIAVDGNGNVYIADTGNNRIVVASPSGDHYNYSQPITGLNKPQGLTVDGQGHIYVADTGNNRIVVDGADLHLTGINSPQDVALDSDGNLYVIDLDPVTSKGRIRKFDAASQGVSPTPDANFGVGGVVTSIIRPSHIAIDARPNSPSVPTGGNIYVTDAVNNRAVHLDSFGGYLNDFQIASGSLLHPNGIAVDADGEVFVADTGVTQQDYGTKSINGNPSSIDPPNNRITAFDPKM